MSVTRDARGSARHQALHATRSGRRSMRWASRSTPISPRTTCGSPRAASRRSCRSTTWKARSGTIAALGKKKRELAEALLRRLQDALRARRLAAHRPGQVVSGRAAAALGAGRLLARRRRAAVARRVADRRHAPCRARPISRRRATSPVRSRSRSDLPPELVLTAYEDVPRLLGDEAALPVNADPLQSDLSDPAERSRLARLLLTGLDRPAGFVLPLKAAAPTQRRDAGADLGIEPVAACAASVSTPWRRLAARPAPAAWRRCRSAARGRWSSSPPVDPFAPSARSLRGAWRDASRRPGRARGRQAARSRQDRADAFRCATATCTSSCRRSSASRTTSRCSARRGHRARDARAGRRSKGYAPPRDPRLRVLGVTPDPGRHRGQHPSRVVVARADRHHRDALRGSAAGAPRHRKVHARRPPHRHRRRQSRHAGRRDAGRQPAAATPRPAAEPGHLLAEPSGAVVSVFRHVRRPDQPGAARRRGARRPPLRARDRVSAARRASTSSRRTSRCRGWSTGRCATC